jgi:hypothetical protein
MCKSCVIPARGVLPAVLSGGYSPSATRSSKNALQRLTVDNIRAYVGRRKTILPSVSSGMSAGGVAIPSAPQWSLRRRLGLSGAAQRPAARSCCRPRSEHRAGVGQRSTFACCTCRAALRASTPCPIPTDCFLAIRTGSGLMAVAAGIVLAARLLSRLQPCLPTTHSIADAVLLIPVGRRGFTIRHRARDGWWA